MTTTAQNIIGRTVNYTGDISNAPRTGFVASVETDRWGTDAVIIWDESESIGWDEYGDAVAVKAETSRIGVKQIVEAARARAGDRFIFA